MKWIFPFAFVIIIHCSSVTKLRIVKSVAMPYRYFHADSNIPIPGPGVHDVPEDKKIKQDECVYLFSNTANLKKSVEAIQKGKLDQAIELLEQPKEKSAEIWNNLGIAYFLKGDKQKAIFALNQAGIQKENYKILHNLRIVTEITAKEIIFYK
ncbi:MAG: tetratricopeptide repeat protein [Candidatus Hydrogenedentota bacterium]|nr:MAG: tetratricopeptide repeat protein [Candidatus Hydrogenedentota bacterium]